MILSGKDCPTHAGPEEVAQATLSCFRQVIPATVPGIVFLSGGQSSTQATENLNAMNAMGKHPWELSFITMDKSAGAATSFHKARCNENAWFSWWFRQFWPSYKFLSALV
jgi:fructose-bisphosphate aldolase class 1